MIGIGKKLVECLPFSLIGLLQLNYDEVTIIFQMPNEICSCRSVSFAKEMNLLSVENQFAQSFNSCIKVLRCSGFKKFRYLQSVTSILGLM